MVEEELYCRRRNKMIKISMLLWGYSPRKVVEKGSSWDVGLNPYNQSFRSVRGSNKMLWTVEPLSHQPHFKSKIQSRDSDSDSESDEEGQEDTLAHQVLGMMHLDLSSWAKRLPTLGKSPLKAALQVIHSQRGFILCLRNWIITALAYNRGFKTAPWIEE
jgi:hypothetical protein